MMKPMITVACIFLKSVWQAALRRSTLIAVLLAPLAVLHAADTPSMKPNILFIAIDDMNDWTGFLSGQPIKPYCHE